MERSIPTVGMPPSMQASKAIVTKDALFFGNLPWDLSAESVAKTIKESCEAHGRVESVRVAQFGTGRHRRRRRDEGKLHHGHAHVIFTSEDGAEKAYEALKDRLDLFGARGSSQVIVEMAVKPPERPPSEEELAREEARRQASELQREHNRRQRKRRIGRHWERAEDIVRKIKDPGGLEAARVYADNSALGLTRAQGVVDWDAMPSACDPQLGGGLGTEDGEETTRSRRKREQTAGFVKILQKLCAGRTGLHIVDFGSGSGNMTLPLAFLFPEHNFTAVDMKKHSVSLLIQKAKEAGLGNIRGKLGMIETFGEDFDIGLALHACGNATDHAMRKSMNNQAAFVVSPCCVGKLKYSLKGGSSFSENWREYEDWDKNLKQRKYIKNIEPSFQVDELQHPSSEWLRHTLSEDEFEVLASYADFHAEAKPIQRLCKLNVEIDRAKGAQERGYLTCIVKLTEEESYPKNDCIIGVHPAGSASSDWMSTDVMLM